MHETARDYQRVRRNLPPVPSGAEDQHYFNVEDQSQVAAALAAADQAGPQPGDRVAAAQASLRTAAGSEAAAAGAALAAAVRPPAIDLPGFTLEGSAPNVLEGGTRRSLAIAFTVLAFLALLFSGSILVFGYGQLSDAPNLPVALVVVTGLAALLSYFLVMGFGTFSLSAGKDDEDG